MRLKNPIKIKNSIATKLLKMVFSFYLFIAIAVTAGHMIMEYRYQKNNISHDLENIQRTFEDSIAIDVWQLHEQSLLSTIDGMLKIPVIVGVKIQNTEGMPIAVSGMIAQGDDAGDAGQHVNLFGLDPEEVLIDERYKLDIFSHKFPLVYHWENQTKQLGQVTIYSNTSVIIRRVKLGFLLLLINALLKTTALWVIFLIFATVLLRKPLAALTDATGKISLDNLDSFKVKISTKDQNELTVLENSFNTMISNLRKSSLMQKKAEKDLKESEEHYRAIADNIGDSIMRYDREFRHVYANRNALEVTGLPKEQYIGKTHREMGFPEPLCALWENNIKKVFQKGKQQSVEFDVELERGLMTFELQLNPEFAPDGSVQTVIGISRDISERKRFENERYQLETQLQQAQKMEAIGTLSGGIAHDFNNILCPILGFAELMEEDISKENPHHENVTEIVAGAKRAKDLVHQILAFSRQGDIKSKPLRPHLIVKEVSKLIRSSIPATIEIKQSISPTCHSILADPTQVHQVVMNLMTNAYHAMQDSYGFLYVTLENIDINDINNGLPELGTGSFVMLSIEDTGIGMSEDVLNQIFEPYFTTKSKDRGTGLGLSVVHGIVKSYGGTIKVQSIPGKGTRFDVYFPACQESVRPDDIEALTSSPGGDERILLVDDEASILKLEKHILTRLGYQVEICEKSSDALEIFKADPLSFDLVVTDMTMPHMTGDVLIQEMMKIRPEIPAVICTGFSEKISEKRVGDIGIKTLLKKPIMAAELSNKIRNVLDSIKTTA